MDVEQMHAARATLEKQVAKAVQDFEQATGLEVVHFAPISRIGIRNLDHIKPTYAVCPIRATVQLPEREKWL